MILREKLLTLAAGKNKSEICRSAGLPVSALDAMINKGRMPRAAKAVRVARALGVSADWLFDDNADWPPPERSGLPSYTDLEVVEDLARRRNLVYRDMIVVHKKLGRDHLKSVEAIALKQAADRSNDEAKVLSNCLRDMNQLSSLTSRMSWLNPDDVHPPEREAFAAHVSLIALPALQKVFDSYQSRTTHVAPAYVAAIENVRMKPGQVLFHPGFGHISLYDDVVTDAQRRHWLELIPLIQDWGLLPPSRCDDGRPRRELSDRVVRYISDDPSAFALKLPAESATDDCPAGTVIVCEPNKELNPIDRCVLVPSQSGGELRIVTGEAILSERPEYRSAADRLRANAGVYPIVATYKPGAGIPEGVHV